MRNLYEQQHAFKFEADWIDKFDESMLKIQLLDSIKK
jgi:hypothetical protein